LTVGGIGNANSCENRLGSTIRLGRIETAKPSHRLHELAASHVLVERVVVGAIADQRLRSPVPRITAANGHATEARFDLTGGELQQRRLARAVRSDEASNSTTQFEGDLVQANDRSVPLRDTLKEQ